MHKISFGILFGLVAITNTESSLNPIVLLPGYFGSQIEASISNETCSQTCEDEDWFTLWFDIRYLVPPLVDTFADYMHLGYDHEENCIRNHGRVKTRVPGFGDTTTIEYLDPAKSPLSSYFAPLVKVLVTDLGYERKRNLYGAPYDFRKSPIELEGYFDALRTLVETAYEKNGRRSVVLLGHSMGGNIALYFLQKQSEAWKSTYIKSLVTLGTPWVGHVKMIRFVVSGDNSGINKIDPLSIRPFLRSPGSIFFFPSAQYWESSEDVISGGFRNYTTNDFQELFEDIGYEDGLFIRSRFNKKYDPSIAPNVETHVIFGSNLQTPIRFVYPVNITNWYDKVPSVVYGDGDGSINANSLKACFRLWKQKQTVHSYEIEGSEHLMMISDKRTHEYIKKLLTSH